MSPLKSFVIVLLCTASAACSTVPNIDNPQPPTVQAPWDGERPKTCLAFSGGGIRSGAVSLGALQALHEVNLLTEADIVASVSGGGYPIYGLLTNAAKFPDSSLDDLLSDDGSYITGVEANSDFISTGDGLFNGGLAALRALAFSLFGPFWSPDLVQDTGGTFAYAIDIHRTFVGFDAPITKDINPLSEIDTASERLGMPYVIFQASGSAGKTPPNVRHEYSVTDDVFELSADWIGSRRFGYWRSYVQDLTSLHAVVASAAAIDAPRVNNDAVVIPNWARRLGFGLGVSIRLADGRAVFLSDGGFAENQAVMPLLERKCQHIIALDAAHDPNASMKAWERVMLAARARGWSTDMPQSQDEHGRSRGAEDSWNLPSHLYSMSVGFDGGERSEISILKLGFIPREHVRYPTVVGRFWDRQLQEWNGAPTCNGKRRLGSRCTFPQQATVKQSFTVDEMRAYRCLGHFMVTEFLAKPNQIAAVRRLVTKCNDQSLDASRRSEGPRPQLELPPF